MRSLASELKQKKMVLRASNAREAQKLYQLLSELGLSGIVEVASEGAKVPDPVFRSGESAALACWLALTLKGTTTAIMGVDLGTSNIGLAIIVDDILAFSAVLRSLERLLHIAAALKEFGIHVLVRIGCPRHLLDLARELAGKLKEFKARVELVYDERIKESVVVGDFVSLGKLSSHELDALKIAIAVKERALGSLHA